MSFTTLLNWLRHVATEPSTGMQQKHLQLILVSQDKPPYPVLQMFSPEIGGIAIYPAEKPEKHEESSKRFD